MRYTRCIFCGEQISSEAETVGDFCHSKINTLHADAAGNKPHAYLDADKDHQRLAMAAAAATNSVTFVEV